MLGWLVFRWAGALYGPAAGLLALTLFVFDPNILAHGGLVTTDLYAAWMITLAVWAFWRFLNHEGSGRWRAATVSAGVFGLAQLAKYTSTYLVPILLLIALGHAAPELWALAREGRWRVAGTRCLAAGRFAALHLVAFLVLVNLGYWGQGTLKPLRDYEFKSRQFNAVQAALGPLAGVRVPVPEAYLQDLDLVLAIERGGTRVYLLGRFGAEGERFPHYYAVLWLYKVPIATQLLLVLALGGYALRFRRFDFRRNEWFLACPVLFFAWYFTFVFNRQKAFRWAIVVLPILFVFTGSLLRDVATMGRGRRAVVGALLLYLVVSVLSYYPHFIPYINELVPDRTKAYRILFDSNIDWRQNEWHVRRYLRRHPGALYEPDDPRAGTIVTSVNKYVAGPPWLRENFEPVGHIAHGHLIFNVTPEALRRVTDPVPADWADKDR
jgi:4-amino-4-deoxy-L-arabinose transferase-like glycosyltransferase